MRHLSHLILACALTMAAFPATAQSLPDDRWEISGAWFEPVATVQGSAHLTGSDGEQTVDSMSSGSTDHRLRGGVFEATYRPTVRQRIVAGWYGVGQDRGHSYSGQGTHVTDDGTTIDYQYAGQTQIETRFELYRLGYGYDLVQAPSVRLTALAGIYGARLKVRASNNGKLEVEGFPADLATGGEVDLRRHAPGLGLAAAWKPTDRWELRARAQGFKTQWGDFDTDGRFVNASLQAGYRFSPHWDAVFGYDWFDLKLKDRVDAGTSVEGTNYSLRGAVEVRLRVHGPTVGLRASF